MRVLTDVGAIARCFDYLVPEALAEQVQVGDRVRVPLGGRRVGGWVVEVGVRPPDGLSLRPLAAWSGWGPPAPVVSLSAWAAWRWAGRPSQLLATASPRRSWRQLPPPGRPCPAGGRVPEAWAEALARGRLVVRLGPGQDRFAWARAAAGRLAQGSDACALVLCPLQAEAEALARRLEAEGFPVALMPHGWGEARAGARVVVGTRAAAWAPAPRLCAGMVLDAHDPAYKEQRAPTYSAWEVVAERCSRDGAPAVMVSPCPSLELLAWGQLSTPPRAEERAGWARVEVVDRRGDDPRTGMVSEALVRALRSASASAPVVCVLNRKGRARLLACAACGELAACGGCGGPLAQVQADQPLACRRCPRSQEAVCQACGSGRLKVLRPGVARLGEELAALAAGPVSEVTGQAGVPAGVPVVVGTEAVLYRPLRAGVVAFLDFDQELLRPQLRASEAALALLARASRAVGGRRGRVLVQTRRPDSPVLDAALHADPGRLAARELELRRVLGMPPARAVALVSGEGAEAFVASLAGVEVLGPHRGAWLVKAESHQLLCDALAGGRRPPGRLRVDVDPLEL
ncbi:MAG TPA: hypothetical protein VKY15_02070 [Acidimicrobiales bacterium]|nr:hypothetical protein [Acidimicrobiales bacterium]